MTSNFMSFFNIFCLHQTSTKPKHHHSHNATDIGILYSKPIDLANTREPSTLILQKNIYKMICNIQPVFFESSFKNRKTYVKKTTVEENNVISFIKKKSHSCWDFSENYKNHAKKMASDQTPNKEPTFFKTPDLIENFALRFLGNFTLIYNYSNDRNIFDDLNELVLTSFFLLFSTIHYFIY